MPRATAHPTPQELNEFGQGKLEKAAAAAVASHLKSCSACREAVAPLHQDSSLGQARAANPSGSSLLTGRASTKVGGGTTLPRNATTGPISPPENLPAELANHPKFRIVRELGRGGMGIVYEAEQTVLKRRAAIKVISPAAFDNPDAVARFHSEVEAAGRLDHPNIVRAHDAEQAGSLHLLVMEFVEGLSLGQVVAKRGPLPILNACNYISQAALGLQHAHERGMVHRDIKPQNLMLTPRGQVKILDFGLARLASERKSGPGLTRAGAFMGTPEYVSPEQATDARTADIRADIYSLGCTLYCLLAGRPPFVEDTLVKLVMAHIEKEAPSLTEARPDVPPALASVVARLLAKNPADRFQTPVEVARALSPFSTPGQKGKEMTVSYASKVVPLKNRGKTLSGDRSRNRPERESLLVRQKPEKSWLILVGTAIALCVLLIGLLGLRSGGVFNVKKKDGTVGSQDLPDNAKALVDGTIVALKTGEGKAAEFGAAAPTKHFDRTPCFIDGGPWRVQGDELVQTDPKPGFSHLIFGDPEWDDYDFSVDAMCVGGDIRIQLALFVRSTTDFYLFGLYRNSCQLEFQAPLKTLATYDAGLENGIWYTARVSVRGNLVQCFLKNGEADLLVFNFEDDGSHPKGRVALRTSWAAFRFKNIKVTAPDGEVLWDGLPDLPGS